MGSTVSIEQEIVDGIRALPTSKQQAVLDFVDFLRYRASLLETETRPSMQEIARLPVHERHRILQKYIPAMVKDFDNDPNLTEFSELDMDEWAVDDVTA